MRLLVLCTHNSARSQMAEGWLRHHAERLGLDAEVWSAGTEATRVKPEAVEAMAEVGIDLSGHTSKTLWDVPDPWAFDVVLTVCDDANETCPAYPARTTRLHASSPDPSGEGPDAWREVRDALGQTSRRLVEALSRGASPTRETLVGDATAPDSERGSSEGRPRRALNGPGVPAPRGRRIGRLTATEVAMDVPEPARALLEDRYQDASWTLLHAWISEDTVLAVVAVADDAVFDPEEDVFDVDGVRIEALQLFDTLQEGWELSEDGAFELGDVFGELVRAYEAEAPEPLES